MYWRQRKREMSETSEKAMEFLVHKEALFKALRRGYFDEKLWNKVMQESLDLNLMASYYQMRKRYINEIERKKNELLQMVR